MCPIRIERWWVRALTVLVLAGLGAPAPSPAAAAGGSRPVQVTVRMMEYMFVPDHLSFRRRVLYRLHLVNLGKEIHEFTAPQFIAAIDLKNPEALGPYTNQFAVDPGQTKDILLVPRQPGHYSLICADHDWAGMTGEIVITP